MSRKVNVTSTLLRAANLSKHFPITGGVFRKTIGQVMAVQGVSFDLQQGTTLGLVGESGSGKSTLARVLVGLLNPSEGQACYRLDDDLKDMAQFTSIELSRFRRNVQLVFQDPNYSLNPRMTVRDIVAEPMDIQRIGTRRENTKRVEELLSHVGLASYHLNRYPHQFSGGQRQRIGIARALSLEPKLIVCDEPVSALDVSVQAQVLNLLKDLQTEFGLAYLFIAHDLSVVSHVSDRVMVMYLGRIVETANADELYSTPQHPYTEALLSAVPQLWSRQPTQSKGDSSSVVPSPSNPPPGCHFHPRCPYATEQCKVEPPPLREINLSDQGTRHVACHHAEKLNLKGAVQAPS